MYGVIRAPLAPRIPRPLADATGMAVTVMGFPSWRCDRAMARDLPEGGARMAADTSRREFTRFCPGLPGPRAGCYEAVTRAGRRNPPLASPTISGVRDPPRHTDLAVRGGCAH